jgi:hypothetical protein
VPGHNRTEEQSTTGPPTHSCEIIRFAMCALPTLQGGIIRPPTLCAMAGAWGLLRVPGCAVSPVTASRTRSVLPVALLLLLLLAIPRSGLLLVAGLTAATAQRVEIWECIRQGQQWCRAAAAGIIGRIRIRPSSLGGKGVNFHPPGILLPSPWLLLVARSYCRGPPLLGYLCTFCTLSEKSWVSV